MTLVVGVICRDGIVFAADRQAQDSGAGIPTVGHSVTKITILPPDSLFAFSGAAAVGQQLCNLAASKQGDWKEYPVHKCITDLQNVIRPALEEIYKGAKAAGPIVGAQIANSDVVCTSLLAAPFKIPQVKGAPTTTKKKELHLLESTPSATIERKLASFVAIGSGKINADSFLGFLRQTFWPKTAPSILDGTLAAYWTLKHAIEQRSSGVGMGIDVFVIAEDGDGFKARQVSESELLEHDEFIAECCASLVSVRDKIATKPSGTPPAPPPTM